MPKFTFPEKLIFNLCAIGGGIVVGGIAFAHLRPGLAVSISLAYLIPCAFAVACITSNNE